MNVVLEDAEVWFRNSKLTLQNQCKKWFVDGLYKALRMISVCSQGVEP